ncbi:MAG: hypothetical protein J5740_02225 [Bacteroidales bacterium]|nr:hypothetical protein [Bacteroidales bacterium]
MKTLRVLFASLLFAAATVAASAAGNTPVIGAERVKWWDAEYLTITWGGGITPFWGNKSSARDARTYILSILDSPSRNDNKLYWSPWDHDIYLGSRVLEVDGRSAYGWNSDRFYDALAAPGQHTLTLEHVGIGVYEATCGYIDVPAWMTAGGFNPYSCKWTRTSYNQMSDRFKIRMDKDVAWRTFSTFDYYFSSDDVLADKELFDVICKMLEENGLHRDQDNPDVVFTLIKDANQSIDYTYVPETREQIQTGSTSTPIYGYKGAYLGSVTKNKYETVTTGGYTQKTASTQAYLEVNFMETKRLGEKVLPLIWQLKYNYHEQSQANIDQLYANAITWVDWPICDEKEEKTSDSCTRFFYGDIPLYDFGIVLDADAVVIGLDKNSDVVKKSGLRIGDRLLGIDVKQSTSLDKSRKTMYSGTLTVDRGGSTNKLAFSKCKRTKFFGKMTFASGRATF